MYLETSRWISKYFKFIVFYTHILNSQVLNIGDSHIHTETAVEMALVSTWAVCLLFQG